jgi:hypothetical protein
MTAFVFFCLFLVLIEIQRRELATRQKSESMARYRPRRERDDEPR